MNPRKPVDILANAARMNATGSKTDRLEARIQQLEYVVSMLDGALNDVLMQSGIIARFAKRTLNLTDSTIAELQNELAFEQHDEKMNRSGFEVSSEPIALGDCVSVIAKASDDPFGMPALAEVADEEVSMVGLKVGDKHTKETPQGNLALEIVKIFKKKAGNEQIQQ